MARYILAYDFGTTGCKTTLHDAQRGFIESKISEYGTYYPQKGWVEQNPREWWSAFCTSTNEVLLRSGIDTNDITCLTFTGHTMGCLPVDRQGRPLRNEILWADYRSSQQAQEISERLDKDEFYRITGHRIQPFFSLPKIMWVREMEPYVYSNTYKFLNAKDWIISQLTGRFVTEPSTASMTIAFDITGGLWSDLIVDAVGLDHSKLPEIVASTEIVGEVLTGVENQTGIPQGTPVVAGGGDGACATLGVGAFEQHDSYLYLGTSAWIAMAEQVPLYEPEQRTAFMCHVVPNMLFESGTMQSAGAAVEWACKQLYSNIIHEPYNEKRNLYKLANEEVQHSPVGANGLIFLPYLMGERCPWWDTTVRGAFIGLGIAHNRRDMMRAVMEGVSLNLRLIIDIFREQGIDIASLPIIGGGAQSTPWLRILADVLGVCVQKMKLVQEETSIGASVLGGMALGLYKDFSVVHRMGQVVDTVEPDPKNHEHYQQIYAIFKQIYYSLRPIHSAMAGLNNSR